MHPYFRVSGARHIDFVDDLCAVVADDLPMSRLASACLFHSAMTALSAVQK